MFCPSGITYNSSVGSGSYLTFDISSADAETGALKITPPLNTGVYIAFGPTATAADIYINQTTFFKIPVGATNITIYTPGASVYVSITIGQEV